MIEVTKISASRRHLLPNNDLELGFGRHFTDHMFLMDYEKGRGWHTPRIEPHAELKLNPAAMVLHYGQEVFEGLKAYFGHDEKIRLFRPDRNLVRMNRSAERLCMPALDTEVAAQGLRQVVLLDRAWIPHTRGTSLYIRPTYIATTPYLGVRPADDYLFYIILSPVAAYYAEGFHPVKIAVSETYVRAAEGGTGSAKTGGNYAASLLAQREARKRGYAQVLWLDAKERRYVEEVGTMNIFFVVGDEVFTSPLGGSILPGVTRDSVITLLKEWGITVTERALDIGEVTAAAREGKLKEVFGTGTAAIISPVKAFAYRDQEYEVGNGGVGPLSDRLYNHILGIQYGEEEDLHGWTEVIG